MFDNKSVETVFEEINENKEKEKFLALTDSKRVYFYSNNSEKSEYVTHKIFGVFKKVFLPDGFPESVSVDYVPYQIWDTLQAFCSTITGTLSTHAIMAGVGVGNEAATPLGATITWILKDGTGHIGRIFFAWWKGSDLDMNSKRWRFIADIMNDLALGIELLFLPLYTGWSTQILCITTAMKAVVGISGGATRAALTQHHSLRGNLADVSAKDGSQETFVNLCASVIAVMILLTIESKMMALCWFVLFTVLHLFANYKAVKSIRLKVLNTFRLLNIYSVYMKSGQILSIEDVNKNENVIFSQDISDLQICGHRIKLGQSLKKMVKNDDLQNLKNAKLVYKDQQFCINAFENTIYISLRKSHSSEDILQAYFHAIIIGIMRSYNSTENRNMISNKNIMSTCSINILRSHSIIFQESCLAWLRLKKLLRKAGWATDQHLLPVGECRAIW